MKKMILRIVLACVMAVPMMQAAEILVLKTTDATNIQVEKKLMPMIRALRTVRLDQASKDRLLAIIDTGIDPEENVQAGEPAEG